MTDKCDRWDFDPSTPRILATTEPPRVPAPWTIKNELDRAEIAKLEGELAVCVEDNDRLRSEIGRLRTNDFLGMGLIIKDQTAELERLHEDIAWKEKIIRTADVTMNKLRSENERLRERVAELQASSGYEASIAQVEIDRLRAALQRIADDGKNCQDYCRNQARRALEPKP